MALLRLAGPCRESLRDCVSFWSIILLRARVPARLVTRRRGHGEVETEHSYSRKFGPSLLTPWHATLRPTLRESEYRLGTRARV